MDEADKIILDLIFQHCYITEKKTVWLIDNVCLSANERATRYLAERGILKDKNGRIYSMSKKIKF